MDSGGDVDEDARATTQQYLAELQDEMRSSGRKFRERCEDLQGGLRLYSFWRIAASESHASTAVADRYIEQRPETESGVALSPDPRPGAHEAWLGTSLTMLVLASLAADRYDPTRRRRTRLKEIARELGTQPRWSKTAKGLERQAAYERAQRQRARAQRSALAGGSPRRRRRRICAICTARQRSRIGTPRRSCRACSAAREPGTVAPWSSAT